MQGPARQACSSGHVLVVLVDWLMHQLCASRNSSSRNGGSISCQGYLPIGHSALWLMMYKWRAQPHEMHSPAAPLATTLARSVQAKKVPCFMYHQNSSQSGFYLQVSACINSMCKHMYSHVDTHACHCVLPAQLTGFRILHVSALTS